MKKICIASITASHYRKRIYCLLDIELNCDFIFGIDDSTVKRLDTSLLNRTRNIQNKYFFNSNWYQQKGLFNLIKGYDVIINDLSVFCFSAWVLLFYSKFSGQKVYNWDHGLYGREGFVKKLIKRAYFGLADGSLIYGNYARNLMIKHGFDGDKLHVIHNSLDYDQQLIIRNSMNFTDIYTSHFGNNNPVLCFIGRLTNVKKLDQIIDALSILKSKGKYYNVVFIGDGSEMLNLTKKVLELQLTDQVWFYGACYDEKINAELIYNADLCVAPGNIGLTAIHAMMFGCPCLTHNDFTWQMPEFEAIRDGFTGTFFERDNVSDLSHTISKWFDENLYKRTEIREACFVEIDNNWNPHNQIEIIKKVIYG